jgi:hypothetical protein
VRRWLIAAVIVVVVGGATALAITAGGGDEGLIPDQVQHPTRPASREPAAPAAQCPVGTPGCRTVSGRIIYVERVDPDGDGDAHFVLADAAGVTGPGISVVDVRVDLRPNPLPGVGDHLSAAGAVATGSYGQSQIEAVAVGG